MSIPRTRSFRTLSALAAAFLLAACGGGGGGGPPTDAKFLTADPRGMTNGGATAPGAPNAAGAAAADSAAAAPAAEAADAAGGLAREIEEADLYRVFGDTLYLLNAHRGLVVADLPTVAVKGKLALAGFPQEMFVVGSRALVLLSDFDGLSSLVDVSVANPAAPSETARFPLGGGYRASRLVGSVLYVATDAAVRSFSIGASVLPVGNAALPHGASFVNATDALLAVAAPSDDGTATNVTLVDISNPSGAVAVRGSIDLPGWMADDRKLDLEGAVLRAVTHDWIDGGLSRLFTVNVANPLSPTLLATLPLARGEQLFAVRFAETAAYVVTFLQVDPLWVIDLSNPAAPTIAGELTMPGWSNDLVVVPGGRLVGLGVDPTAGWTVTASLIDVSLPSSPALLDRVDFGAGWSNAFWDVKALGVFPAEGFVLAPISGDGDRLAVIDLSANDLSIRGFVPMDGTVLRGFPHPRGLVGVSSEEVVVVDPSTLGVRGRATIAENVVDGCRLPNGTVLPLVAKSRSGLLGTFALPLIPDRCFPYGDTITVTGWDDTGRAAYVVDFTGPAPVLSARFDLGGAWFSLGGVGWGAPAMDRGGGIWWGGGTGLGDAILTDDGHLVVHGVPGLPGWNGGPGMGGGGEGDGGGVIALGNVPELPSATDGFVVIDVAHSALDAPIDVSGYVSGFAADGGDLLYTVGGDASADQEGRPRMRHDLVRLDLATRVAAPAARVPGYVLAAKDGLVFTVEESWTSGWSWECAVVACSVPVAGGDATVVDRRVLPEGAYDLRAAGSTLYYTATTFSPGPDPLPVPPGYAVPAGSVAVSPNGMDPGSLWWPTTSIATIRLGPTLSAGPEIADDGHFLTLLFAEDGSALVVRDGMNVQRFDLTGPAAVLSWSKDVGAYPVSARADPAAGSYLLALGYAGLVSAP